MGVQIGSNKQPPKEPFIMTTTFPGEVTLLSYEVSFKTNTDAKFDVTIGEYTKSTEVAANKAVTGYGEEDLSLSTTSFSFSLSNQTKAVYLYSLSLTLLVPSDVDLDLPEAEDDLTPAKPGEGVAPEANYEAVTPEPYYADIDFEAEKTILTQELAELISNMTKISYGEAGPILIYADESISKPGSSSTWPSVTISFRWSRTSRMPMTSAWAGFRSCWNGMKPTRSMSLKSSAFPGSMNSKGTGIPSSIIPN